MFGIASTSTLEAQRFTSARRTLAWENPTGMAPLMAFLAMMGDGETTNSPYYEHFEERTKFIHSTTEMANAAGPFVNADGTDMTDGGSGITVADSGVFRFKVASAERFRTRDVLWLKGLTVGSGATDRRAIVTSIDTDTNIITLRAFGVWTGVRNTTANNDIVVMSVGTASAEGERANFGGMTFPVTTYNQTQIFRTTIGPFTRTAGKQGMKWDKTGAYKKAAKDGQIRHSVQQEMAALFGEYRTDTVQTKDGFNMPERKMGGMQWYLKQWDKGNTTNGGLFNYRPDGADLTNSAFADAVDKRNIELAGANLTREEWDELMRRLFIYNSGLGFEKLCLCDTKFLFKFNSFARNNSIPTRVVNEKSTTYGMQVVTYETEAGVVHFKTSPIFNDSPFFDSSAFFLDMGSISYRPFQDTDTELYPNRQAKDADYRFDEWITESGIEIDFPERSMYVGNLGKLVS